MCEVARNFSKKLHYIITYYVILYVLYIIYIIINIVLLYVLCMYYIYVYIILLFLSKFINYYRQYISAKFNVKKAPFIKT